MPLEAKTLPTRRDEAWKWTDVSRSIGDITRGQDKAAPVQIFVPEGATVTRSETRSVANDSNLQKLSTDYAGQLFDIAVPAGFSSDQPIQIEGLTPWPCANQPKVR